MTRSALAGIGAFLAAFVASSHHTLHMMLLSVGVGIGSSSLLFNETTRRIMLGTSLVMTAAAAWWLLRKPHKGTIEIAAVVAGTVASLALIGWTVMQHGW